MAKIIFIDNFDSFTYNLVDEFRVLGHEIVVYRNDVATDFIVQSALDEANTILALSPGSGSPRDAGNLLDIIHALKDKVAILGICLGHQAIIEVFGGTITHADEIMHGKVSYIKHNNQGVFAGLNNPMPVARYHSLCGTNLPTELSITAYYDNTHYDNKDKYSDIKVGNSSEQQPLVMAIAHKSLPICGFQFHPESILTLQGSQLLKQTVQWLLNKSVQEHA